MFPAGTVTHTQMGCRGRCRGQGREPVTGRGCAPGWFRVWLQFPRFPGGRLAGVGPTSVRSAGALTRPSRLPKACAGDRALLCAGLKSSLRPVVLSIRKTRRTFSLPAASREREVPSLQARDGDKTGTSVRLEKVVLKHSFLGLHEGLSLTWGYVLPSLCSHVEQVRAKWGSAPSDGDTEARGLAPQHHWFTTKGRPEPHPKAASLWGPGWMP